MILLRPGVLIATSGNDMVRVGVQHRMHTVCMCTQRCAPPPLGLAPPTCCRHPAECFACVQVSCRTDTADRCTLINQCAGSTSYRSLIYANGRLYAGLSSGTMWSCDPDRVNSCQVHGRPAAPGRTTVCAHSHTDCCCALRLIRTSTKRALRSHRSHTAMTCCGLALTVARSGGASRPRQHVLNMPTTQLRVCALLPPTHTGAIPTRKIAAATTTRPAAASARWCWLTAASLQGSPAARSGSELCKLMRQLVALRKLACNAPWMATRLCGKHMLTCTLLPGALAGALSTAPTAAPTTTASAAACG